MKYIVALLAILFVVVAPVGVSAQSTPNVVNPGTLVFTVSADHALLNGYAAGVFLPGAATPFVTIDIGKPVPDAAGQATVAINVKPVKFATDLTVRVIAIAEGASSEWSEPSNPFDRKPGPPSKPAVLVAK